MVSKLVLMNRKYQYFIISTLCLICYGFSLHGDFVFDDSVAIVQNTDVTNLNTPISIIFQHDFWGFNLTDKSSHKSYRPLTILMFRLENLLFGLKPIAMKSINLLLHIFVSCGLIDFYTHYLRTSNTIIPFLAATIFAVHPIHTEAVCGIVGRPDIIVAAFLLIVFKLCTKQLVQKSIAMQLLFYVFIATTTAAAILFKETGITLLPIVIAFDLGQSKFRRLFVLLVFTVTFIYLRLKVMNFESPKFKAMDNPLAASPKILTRVLTQSYLYALNFWLMICPDWLSFDWALGSIPLVTKIDDQRNLGIIVLALFFASCAIFGSRQSLFSILLIIIAFLPASGLIKLGFVIAERVLYVPSIGYCALIAIGLHRLRYKLSSKVVSLFIVIIIGAFISKTITRSFEWRKEKTLFRSALRVVPNNAKVYYNIARLATDNNEKAIAFNYYEKAIELHPEYESAYMNLGNLYRETGDYRQAEKKIKKSLQILQEFPAAWMNLGIVQAAQKYNIDALHSYQKALKYRKRYPVCLYNIGNLYIEMKNDTMALKFWREAVALDPRQNKAWANILALLDKSGLTDEVIKTSDIALKHSPNDPAIMFTRANAYGKIGDFVESERIFKDIIRLRPTHALYHANLGVLYHRWNKTTEAVKSYREALRLDPHMVSAHENLIKLTNK